jgi:hypothetical protein
MLVRSNRAGNSTRTCWFRDLDSNQDTQLQRLMSYRLDDPGSALGIVAEPRELAQAPPASGCGVPMRTQEVADRAGKQADGSAKTREAKLVTIWTAESRDEQGPPVRDPGSITYSAAIESAATPDTSPELSDFAARVQREANRRGFSEAQRPAVLGDGSSWIWNTATELFPQATQILDRFHAKEHLSQVTCRG